MIVLNTPEVVNVTVDTVRLAYCELSFEQASVRAILSYGTTDGDGNFTEVRRQTINLDPSVEGLAQTLSDARDAIEALLLVTPPEVTDADGNVISAPAPVITAIAEQRTEPTVGKLQVGGGVGIKPSPVERLGE